MFDHELMLVHRRRPMMEELGVCTAASRTEITSDSHDLVEAWREMMTRMPSDVYGALKAAMVDR